MCAVYAKKDDEEYLFVNVYFPNNHYDSVTFQYELESWLSEAFEENSNINICISGDFNFVFDPQIDSIGRTQTVQEKRVVEIFKKISTKYSLVDTYRVHNDYGGYTWGRDNPCTIRSRLDHIFVSKNMLSNLLSCNTNIRPNESDHKTVYAEFNIEQVKYGPGIIRANSNLLEKPNIKRKIIDTLKNELESIPLIWDPHMKLDFAKYKLRELLLAEGKIAASKMG